MARDMKKLVRYISVLAATLFAVSCSFDGLETVSGDSGMIELGVECLSSPVVRADLAGDNDYNENTVFHVDYFIFNVDPVQNPTTASIISGRISDYGETGIMPTAEDAENYLKKVDIKDYLDQFTNDNTGWIYVIANLPDAAPIKPTYNALQGIEFTSAFTTSLDAKNIEGYVNKDNQFVMASSEVQSFRVDGDSPQVIASLKRVTAKVMMNLNIRTEVQADGQTWYPDVEHVQIYMYYANKHGNIAGTPEEYASTNSYNTPRYAMFSGGKKANAIPETLIGTNFSKEVAVAYRYHEEPDTEGNYYYNDYETQEFTPLTSVPLYSYPLKWTLSDTYAPFIKIIVPWCNKENGELVNPTESYYKLALPKFNQSTDESTVEEAYEFRSNYCYAIDLDLSILGGADEIPVEVFGNYYVVDWADSYDMGGAISTGRYLDVASEFDMYGDMLEIPLKSSHSLTVNMTSATYTDYSSLTPTTENLTQSTSVESVTGTNYYIVSPDRNTVELYHTPSTNLDNMQAYDVSPITYTFTLEQEGDGGLESQVITVHQYPSLYIKNEESARNGNYYSNGFSRYQDGYIFVNAAERGDYDDWRYVHRLSVNRNGQYSSGDNNNPNMYVITTSVISSNLDYSIGDVRVDTYSDLDYNSWATAPAVGETDDRELTYYYKTDTGDRTKNMISPSFRIASSYGQTIALTYNVAERRCASYQESGYPAGRWRVPTKAELEYITTLSSKELIPSLFDYDSPRDRAAYWSAQGAMCVNSDGSVSEYDGSEDEWWVRCVYDEWYWSDTVDKGTFTWGDKAR